MTKAVVATKYFYDQGLTVMKMNHRTKFPPKKGFADYTRETLLETFKTAQLASNIALRCGPCPAGNIIMLDLDVDEDIFICGVYVFKDLYNDSNPLKVDSDDRSQHYFYANLPKTIITTTGEHISNHLTAPYVYSHKYQCCDTFGCQIWLFKEDKEITVGNWAKQFMRTDNLRLNIDVRCEGGYSMVLPSEHPETGKRLSTLDTRFDHSEQVQPFRLH